MTRAFTTMKAGTANNVLADGAEIGANVRLLPGITKEEAALRMQQLTGDPDITVRVNYGDNASAVSRTDCEAWETLCRAIRSTWTDAIVSPYLMIAGSDSRHYSGLSDKVYRFSCMALSKEERSEIHGDNERVPISTIRETVSFYIRLMREM